MHDHHHQLPMTDAALRRSTELYRALFDSIDEGLCVVEMRFDEMERPLDYRFLEVNAAFEKQTGLVNAVGQWMRRLRPTHEEYWFDLYGRVALTGEPVRFENRAGALQRWYNVYAFRIGAPEDRLVAILFNDITDRKQSAEALQRRTAQFETLLNAAPMGVFLVEADFRISQINPAGEVVDQPSAGASSAEHAALHQPNQRIRVLLVDDHAMVRRGLRTVLEEYADIDVVGEASDGEEAIDLVARHVPAVVVMDVNMPRMGGIEATERIHAAHPSVMVIGLSVNAGPDVRSAILRAGAVELLTKEAAVEELYRAVMQIRDLRGNPVSSQI